MQYCCVSRSVHLQRRINRRHSPGKEIISVTNRVGYRVTRIAAECSIGYSCIYLAILSYTYILYKAHTIIMCGVGTLCKGT